MNFEQSPILARPEDNISSNLSQIENFNLHSEIPDKYGQPKLGYLSSQVPPKTQIKYQIGDDYEDSYQGPFRNQFATAQNNKIDY